MLHPERCSQTCSIGKFSDCQERSASLQTQQGRNWYRQHFLLRSHRIPHTHDEEDAESLLQQCHIFHDDEAPPEHSTNNLLYFLVDESNRLRDMATLKLFVNFRKISREILTK